MSAQKVKAAERVKLGVSTAMKSECQKVRGTIQTQTLALSAPAAKDVGLSVWQSPASRQAVNGNRSKENVVSSDASTPTPATKPSPQLTVRTAYIHETY